MKQNILFIDFLKQKSDFFERQDLHEFTEILFDNYAQRIELPISLNEFPNITKVKFYSNSKDGLFEMPDNLEKLIHIKHLILWGYGDFTKIKPMPQIEELDVSVKNMEEDSRIFTTLFPNLKKMEIRGNHSENQKLSDEIGNLTNLTSLHLISCGLDDLPDTFVNLKQLKELHLNSTLNNGIMEVAGIFNDEELNLKPIPDCIGKLENLEDLNLAMCGVFDLSPIFSLSRLKKLNLQCSALKNCDGFSNFPLLEGLNIEASYDLEDLNGLKGLPIKKLNLSSNYFKSVEVISSLTQLEVLDITGCDYIENYAAIYKHPNLKKLRAVKEIKKKWKKREQYNSLNPIGLVISQLETNSAQDFENALLELSKHVDANFNSENNPLAGYFGVKVREEEITAIEVLDSAVQKHLKNLSEEALIIIFEMTFKSVGSDNYNSTLLALEEIILRKNAETQQKIVKKFYKACEYYDAGHRYWGYTVHDQLIDNLFPKFTSQALYKLLKKASNDMLNCEGGDEMDALFIPAFQNTGDKILQEKILNVFSDYRNESVSYYGEDYFDDLQQRIKNVTL